MDQRLTEPAVTDWRGLCEELVRELHGYASANPHHDSDALVARVRAALAGPEREVVVPTDEELESFLVDVAAANGDIYRAEPLVLARAVLARWGHQPAPPAEIDCPACEGVPKPGNQPCAVCGRSALSAEGEVADEAMYLAKELRDQADDMSPALELFGLMHRAADLLEHQAAPAPMASDTRYEFSVLDADCTEQAGGSAPTYAQALSEGQHYLAQYQQDGPHTLEVRRVEVLHPDALPLLPEGAQVIEPAKHTILVPVPVPVAVSERLPGPEDCDGEGRCWFLRFPFDYSRESWSLEDRTYGCNTGFTHWLPATALPLPQGEVEA